LRYGLRFLFAAVLFRRQVSYRKFLHLPWREWCILLLRLLILSVIANGLYTLATEKAKIGPVAFMQVLPSTAILGVVLMHEKISPQRAFLVMASFFGAAIVVVNNVHDLTGFNVGEMLSLISGVLYGLAFVMRKWHTGILNNQEIALAMAGIGAVVYYVLSLILYRRPFIPASRWNVSFACVLLVGGMVITAMQFLVNYGFEHVSAVVAGNILSLEQVFGVLFGLVFYGELLNGRQIIGGTIILVSVILMNQLARREHGSAQIAAVPD
jgi:drug/metabolite transporter (DMT)-like permease